MNKLEKVLLISFGILILSYLYYLTIPKTQIKEGKTIEDYYKEDYFRELLK